MAMLSEVSSSSSRKLAATNDAFVFGARKHGDTCPRTSKSANKGNIHLGRMKWNKKPMWRVLTAEAFFFSFFLFFQGNIQFLEK